MWSSRVLRKCPKKFTKALNDMKSNGKALFLLLALSTIVIQATCDQDNDDTSVVDAADLGEDSYFPHFEPSNSIQCADTEEYSRCDGNPDCQRSCDNLNLPGIACPKRSCIEGCICRVDFVRSQLYGGCVPEDQCGRVKH